MTSLSVLRATPMVSSDAETWCVARYWYGLVTMGAASAMGATMRLRERRKYTVFSRASRVNCKSKTSETSILVVYTLLEYPLALSSYTYSR